MLLAALVLAVATATPSPTPKPHKADLPAQEMGLRPQTGLPNAAGQIKLKKGVSFDQAFVPTPTPTPALLPDGTAAKAAAPKPGSPASASTDAAMEAAWRAKYRVCRDNLRSAKAALEAAELANPPVYNQAGQLLVLAETQRNATISGHKAKLAAAESAMTSLPEDCRKAGCQPGWLRD